MGNFTELDMYLFGQATHYDIYKKLGAHPAEIRKKRGFFLMSGHHMLQKSMSLEPLMTGMRQQIRCGG